MTHRVIEEILEDNNWRDGELAMLKVNSYNVDQKLWDRMSIPMIYAHWEGFVANSLRTFFEFLNKLELDPAEVHTKYLVVCFGNKYRSLSGKQSFSQRVEFTDKFQFLLQNNLHFSKSIDTKSNLNSKVLSELCNMLAFNYSLFSDVVGDLDRIVTLRNKIAHGENSIIPVHESIDKYIVSVTTATDILLGELDRFITEKGYLKITA